MKRGRFFYQRMMTIRFWIHCLKIMSLKCQDMLKDPYRQKVPKVFAQCHATKVLEQTYWLGVALHYYVKVTLELYSLAQMTSF